MLEAMTMLRTIPIKSTSLRRMCLVAGTVLCCTATALGQQHPTSFPDCRPDRNTASLKGVPEASGLAASRRNPGHFYTHNDANAAELFVIDASGSVIRKIPVPDVKLQDWEAIAVGACPSGSCIYIADIGDNSGKRDRISIYRLSEPDASGELKSASEAFHATYPDGGHDAETILIGPDGRLFVVTKGPVALYAFPHDLRAGTTTKLTRVGQAGPKDIDRITDGAVSPNGDWVALRSKEMLFLYRATDLLSGRWRESRRIDLKSLGEPQGEGVTFTTNAELFLAGESGGKSGAGSFARLRCG
jgi:hypothetical protein